VKIIHQVVLGIFLCLASLSLFSEEEPLKIGTESFAPPFVTIGAGNHIYGFDADMMQMLCNSMKRTCQFQAMPFNKLVESTASGKIDMALSAMAITMERLEIVNFSDPYLIIYLRLLTKTTVANQPFSMSVLDNKRIGYENGTILADRIRSLAIKNPKLRAYKHIEDEIVALSNGSVDFVVLDNPTALYWQNNASGDLSTFGEPLPSGIGLGIAVNPKKPELLVALNAALHDFLNKGGFHATYNKYLAPFINPESSINTKP
jgi:polar amino acid transport system substrate-binding protein